jgi:plastocyanin
MRMMRNTMQWIAIGASLAFCGDAFPGLAATIVVNVGANAVGTAADVFVPATNNINVNDKVIWSWVGSFHSTTSGNNGVSNGLWDSGVNNPPHSFTNTFASAGSFPFYCSVHFASGMKGLINVAASDVPPTISITNPPDGATFSAPASLTLAATASDSDGSVTNVEFFQGASSLGNVAAPPYSVSVNNLAAADYAFSAVAADNSGLKATNAVLIHVVTPVSIVISGPVFLPPSDFHFNYTVNVGLSYIVQQSADLINWTTINTNKATVNPVFFDDPNATVDPGFYRVGLLPNP